MLYDITHRTTYSYGADVAVSHHFAHLHPRVLPSQEVTDFKFAVEPAPAVNVERVDYYGNTTTFFTISNPHDRLVVSARSRVRVTAPVVPASSLPWQQVRDRCASDLFTPDSEVGEFRFDSPHVNRRPALADYAAQSFLPDRPLLDALIDFNSRIFRDFKFDSRATTISTPVDEVFKKRRGVCQDFAHFGIACLRSLGLPARYVSGYLETLAPPGKARLIGADASHAWFSVWSAGHGWVDADPTNNVLPGDRHITVALGRDYSDVSPLRGVVIGGREHSLGVSVDVARVAENPAPAR